MICKRIGWSLVAALAAVIVGCGPSGPEGTGSGTTGSASQELAGEIKIDGSSTVYPISQALAEVFMDEQPNVRVTVSFSGTGGGFKKFIGGEIDIAGASRPIEQKEADDLKAKGIEFVEIPVAFDGLTIAVNPKNTWVDNLTVDELKKIWINGSTVMTWQDVRPEWPAKPIKLFGAGTDSGTFDYFTEAICGGKGKSRSDYTASEDDNQLVLGVAGEENALGYFGYSYYEQSADKLKLVPVNGGSGPVSPSPATIMDGTYQPLSRPLFLYVSKSAMDKPETKGMMDFFFKDPATLVKEAKYIPLNSTEYATIQKMVGSGSYGSRFLGSHSGTHIAEVLAKEPQK